jgi:hypothetical protein
MYIPFLYIFWGIWGDIAISLMWRGFIAPQMYFLLGEIPRKNGEIKTPKPNAN